MTSRWVVDVAPRKGVPVRWRTYSLAIKNAGIDVPEPYRSYSRTSQQALRVIEAVWADHGDEPIGRLYTEIGTRFHLDDDKSLHAVDIALKAAGLDEDYMDAAEDEHWDSEIRWSMNEASEVVGTDVGVPILVFQDGDERAGIFGPVVSPAPAGDKALDLWDAVVAMTWTPSFYELKRSRTGPPQLT
jgi:hypothetical protein